MNIHIVKPPQYNFNRLWRAVRREPWLRSHVQRQIDLPLAHDLLRQDQRSGAFQRVKARLAAWLLGPMTLQGAMYGYESRRWMNSDTPTEENWTSTGVKNNYTAFDRFAIDTIGCVFGVASTTTALVLNFDLAHGPYSKGTKVARLDGTNGVVTCPIVNAIGDIVYKDLSEKIVDLNYGWSVGMNVVTPTTAGRGLSFITGFPVNDEIANAINKVTKSA